MCGILGATNKNWNLENALKALRHRGPDAQKIIHAAGFSLGFARLAIIDLSRDADQPMTTPDQKVWIVFNGEIYGFQTLREELISRGHSFRTKSDTEVVLAAYLQWGDQFVDHIDGMFAIAILDLRADSLKIFRDRPGIKPLYYYFDGEEFAFASELKGIEQLCPRQALRHDTTALYDYLTYHYIPEPKTAYKNVFKLLPAHQLTFDIKTRQITKNAPYWKLDPYHIRPAQPIETVCEELRALIKGSVKDQLVADVPLGCFLSGGIDSSVIAAEAKTLKPDLETFTIGFEKREDSETEFAELVARKFNTRQHTQILKNIEFDKLFPQLKSWFDEPFADTSAFPTYFVSQFARQRMTVVLTGDGGDEIFGGYTRLNFFKLISKMPHLPKKTLKRAASSVRPKFRPGSLGHYLFCGIESLFSDDLASYSIMLEEMPLAMRLDYARKWQIPKDYDDHWYFRKYYQKDLPALTRLQYLEFHTYLPSDILTKVDRTSMSVSLEARVPFLSRKIIEFMFSLPEEIRFYQGRLKGFLKEAYKDILPIEILTRGKKGFGIPFRYVNQNYETIHGKILSDVFKIT